MLVAGSSFGALSFSILLIGAGTGIAYSLWFKRSPFAWLPYLIALPLLSGSPSLSIAFDPALLLLIRWAPSRIVPRCAACPVDSRYRCGSRGHIDSVTTNRLGELGRSGFVGAHCSARWCWRGGGGGGGGWVAVVGTDRTGQWNWPGSWCSGWLHSTSRYIDGIAGSALWPRFRARRHRRRSSVLPGSRRFTDERFADRNWWSVRAQRVKLQVGIRGRSRRAKAASLETKSPVGTACRTDWQRSKVQVTDH